MPAFNYFGAHLLSFPTHDVSLCDDDLLSRQRRNHAYLLGLDADRLLHNFRVNAGLPSSVTPLGGWEAPSCGLRGHFVGHYLSAISRLAVATGDAPLRSRAEYLVRALAACQAALGGGYLSAFPASELDAIEQRAEGAWAPYYTLHKLLAGLVDAYNHCDSEEALRVATNLGTYIRQRIERLSTARLDAMLRTDATPNPANEFGGMAQVLRDLAAATQDDAYAHLATIFEPEWFFRPLMQHDDRLAGLHCNTHIPMVYGAVRRYEITGDVCYRDAAVYFWERTASHRSYVNGGSSGPRPDGTEKSQGAEHWPMADQLADTLTPKINESCVTHNMLQLTDSLFRCSGHIRYAEFHERAFFNSVLAMQNPNYLGGYLYDHPLSPGSHKKFGGSEDTFWCCYGTSVEAFARLEHGIYYRGDGELWINQFVSSEARWPEKGLTLEQQVTGHGRNVLLVFRCDSAVRLSVHLRIPTWADDAIAQLNGREVSALAGSYVSIERDWQEGETLVLTLQPCIRAETMPDDPRMIAFLYGALVLAARTDANLTMSARDADEAIKRVTLSDESSLTFRTRLADGRDIELVPLNRIVDETFGVYFTLTP